jgi:hypothetical protein
MDGMSLLLFIFQKQFTTYGILKIFYLCGSSTRVIMQKLRNEFLIGCSRKPENKNNSSA